MDTARPRVATVEDYNEMENEVAPGGSFPTDDDVDDSPFITIHEHQPHPCTPQSHQGPSQSGPAHAHAHAHDQPLPSQCMTRLSPPLQQPTYAETKPERPPMPAVPTPPATTTRHRRASSKPKKSSSPPRRSRKQDRPQYYGVRADSRGNTASAVTVVVPVHPGSLPRKTSVRMSRRPTTGWYEADDQSPPVTGSSPPRLAPAGLVPPSRDHRAANIPDHIAAPHVPLRSSQLPSNVMQTQRASTQHQYQHQHPQHPQHPQYPQHPQHPLHPQHPQYPQHSQQHPQPPHHPQNQPELRSSGVAPLPVRDPHYEGPPVPVDHGLVVLSEPHRGPPAGNPVDHSQGNRHYYPSQSTPAAHSPNDSHGIVILSSNNGPRPENHGPHPPSPQDGHGVQRQNDGYDNMPQRHPQTNPSQGGPHGIVTLHQSPGRQQDSQGAEGYPPQRPHTSYTRARDLPGRERQAAATHTIVQGLQGLAIQDPHGPGRRTYQDTPAQPVLLRCRENVPPSHPSAEWSGPHQGRHANDPPINHGRDQDKVTHAGPDKHSQTYQQRSDNQPPLQNPQAHSRQPPALYQNRSPERGPDTRNWPDFPPKPIPNMASQRQPPYPVHVQPANTHRRGESRAERSGYSRELSYYPPTKAVRRQDRYDHEPEESYDSDSDSDSADSTPSSGTQHPDDVPTLVEGHPFLRMKDMALATTLKEFRSWQRANNTPSRRHSSSKPKAPLACPFSKKDPLRYRDCFAHSLRSLADVKDHVVRSHTVPIYCPRCMERFDDEKARDQHIRYAGCPAQAWACPDGITESQKRELRRSVPTYLSKRDQWNLVFDIVFQRQLPTPASPYVDPGLHADMTQYRKFLEAHGPRILSDTLTFRGAATWNLPNEERDLAAFRFLVLDEGIRDMVAQSVGGGAAAGGNGDRSPTVSRRAPPTPSLSSSNSVGQQATTPSMGSFASSDGQRSYRGGNGGDAPPSPVEERYWDPKPLIYQDGGGWNDHEGQRPEHSVNASVNANANAPIKVDRGGVTPMYPGYHDRRAAPYAG